MGWALASLLIALAVSDLPSSDAPGRVAGTIEGVVVNASQGNAPVPGAEAILQVQLEGQFAPVERTETDQQGRFRFDNLPVGSEAVYLPGAARDEIFYPGRRIQLTKGRYAYVKVSVHDAVSEPNPLVIRQHEVVIRGEPGALHVVEAMLVDNPQNTTYVGKTTQGQPMAATFRLGIPADFDRLTFQQEFFGRQFHLVNGQVVTTIPWTPGKRWLRFTYSIPNEEAHCVWEHQLDVPCEHLLVRIHHEHPEEITSNLGEFTEVTEGEAVFESAGTLSAGHLVQVSLGQLPRAWTYYARWLALVVLGVSVMGAAWLRGRRQRQVVDTVIATAANAPPPNIRPSETGQSRVGKQARKKRRRRAA